MQDLQLVGFIAHVLLWFGALVIVASGSWLLIEEPILRLKRFFPYVQKQPVQLAPYRLASTAASWSPVVPPNGLPELQTHVLYLYFTTKAQTAECQHIERSCISMLSRVHLTCYT
jgi:hypothetical protein